MKQLQPAGGLQPTTAAAAATQQSATRSQLKLYKISNLNFDIFVVSLNLLENISNC